MISFIGNSRLKIMDIHSHCSKFIALYQGRPVSFILRRHSLERQKRSRKITHKRTASIPPLATLIFLTLEAIVPGTYIFPPLRQSRLVCFMLSFLSMNDCMTNMRIQQTVHMTVVIEIQIKNVFEGRGSVEFRGHQKRAPRPRMNWTKAYFT